MRSYFLKRNAKSPASSLFCTAKTLELEAGVSSLKAASEGEESRP